MFEAEPDASIHQVKVILGERVGMNSDDMHLIYMGVQLCRTRTLMDYNIEREATIYLVQKLGPQLSYLEVVNLTCLFFVVILHDFHVYNVYITISSVYKTLSFF